MYWFIVGLLNGVLTMVIEHVVTNHHVAIIVVSSVSGLLGIVASGIYYMPEEE